MLNITGYPSSLPTVQQLHIRNILSCRFVTICFSPHKRPLPLKESPCKCKERKYTLAPPENPAARCRSPFKAAAQPLHFLLSQSPQGWSQLLDKKEAAGAYGYHKRETFITETAIVCKRIVVEPPCWLQAHSLIHLIEILGL
uniref:Uncharacterized protein n=1 Tax=Sphaerodactylus townsendi TaxID=933632 RepID=A0ACB8E7T5_9SAUR